MLQYIFTTTRYCTYFNGICQLAPFFFFPFFFFFFFWGGGGGSCLIFCLFVCLFCTEQPIRIFSKSLTFSWLCREIRHIGAPVQSARSVILVVEGWNANMITAPKGRTKTNEQKLLYPINKWCTDCISPVCPRHSICTFCLRPLPYHNWWFLKFPDVLYAVFIPSPSGKIYVPLSTTRVIDIATRT